MKKLTSHFKKCLIVTTLFMLMAFTANAQKLKVVIAGLNHNHVYGILNKYRDGQITLLGIAEPSKALWVKFGKLYNIPDSLFYTDLKTLVQKTKPDAVLGYNA